MYALNVEHRWRGKRLAATVRNGEETILADYVDPTSDVSRRRFLGKLQARVPALADDDLNGIDTKLMGIASDRMSGQDDSGGRASQADLLVGLAEQVELFHPPGEDEGYAAFDVDSHREVWQLTSRGFRVWLAHRFYVENEKAPSAAAIQDAIAVLRSAA